MKKSGRPKSVDEYIAGTPPAIRAKLGELRAAIKKAAPDAEERISYGMPYYHYKGRVAYFQMSTNHIGLYIPPPIIQKFAGHLGRYHTSTAAIRFPMHKKLPVALIRTLVTERVRMNEVSATQKKL